MQIRLIAQHICQSRFKIYPNSEQKIFKNCPNTFKFGQSGEILPNLVSLPANVRENEAWAETFLQKAESLEIDRQLVSAIGSSSVTKRKRGVAAGVRGEDNKIINRIGIEAVHR